jgi:hypothetical protein
MCCIRLLRQQNGCQFTADIGVCSSLNALQPLLTLTRPFYCSLNHQQQRIVILKGHKLCSLEFSSMISKTEMFQKWRNLELCYISACYLQIYIWGLILVSCTWGTAVGPMETKILPINLLLMWRYGINLIGALAQARLRTFELNDLTHTHTHARTHISLHKTFYFTPNFVLYIFIISYVLPCGPLRVTFTLPPLTQSRTTVMQFTSLLHLLTLRAHSVGHKATTVHTHVNCKFCRRRVVTNTVNR